MNENFAYPMFCYRDVKAGSFSPPFCAVNTEVAKRMFDFQLHNDNSMGFSPGDYELYRVGTFYGMTGKVEGQMPDFIVGGAELF